MVENWKSGQNQPGRGYFGPSSSLLGTWKMRLRGCKEKKKKKKKERIERKEGSRKRKK